MTTPTDPKTPMKDSIPRPPETLTPRREERTEARTMSISRKSTRRISDMPRDPKTECFLCVHHRFWPGRGFMSCAKPTTDILWDIQGAVMHATDYPSKYDCCFKKTLCPNFEVKKEIDHND